MPQFSAASIYYRARSSEVKYLTAPVRRGDIIASVQATGTINPLTTIPVGSYVSGTVEYIFADFNTRVHNGQVLAQLDPAIYEAQVAYRARQSGKCKGEFDDARGQYPDRARLISRNPRRT